VIQATCYTAANANRSALLNRGRTTVCQSTRRCGASAETVVSSSASASVTQTIACDVSTAPRRDQLVLLGPGRCRTRWLRAAPDPLEPDDQHWHLEARRVRRLDPPPAVANRHNNTAASAACRVAVGLERDQHLRCPRRTSITCMPLGVEHRIGAGTPAWRAAPTVVHVGVFIRSDAWSLPILKTSTRFSRLRHAERRSHAQIRRTT
jgi:hypothetical protein